MALQIEAQGVQPGVGQALPAIGTARSVQVIGVATLVYPGPTQLGQPSANIDTGVGIGVGTATVIHRERRILLRSEKNRRIGLSNFSKGHTNIGPAADFVYFARSGQRGDGRRIDFGCLGKKMGSGVHESSKKNVWSRIGTKSGIHWRSTGAAPRTRSQHRHYPYWYEGTLSTGGRRPRSTPAYPRILVVCQARLMAHCTDGNPWFVTS